VFFYYFLAITKILIPAEERRKNLATAVKNKVSISDLNYQWTTEDAPWTKYFNKIFGMSLNESEPIVCIVFLLEYIMLTFFN